MKAHHIKSGAESVAVIGAGVAGLTTAWLLQQKYNVDLYDGNSYAGGHTRTVTVPDGPDTGTPIDTGFIVMNDRNYPLFRRLLGLLKVETRDSDMSFSYYDENNGYTYSGSSLNTLFAQRRNLFSANHWSMIRDITKFNHHAQEDLANEAIKDETLQDYIIRRKLGSAFANQYLYPMGSAIWSSPCGDIHTFPAKAFLHFFSNHGLLTINDRPQWKCVAGGSQTYVKTMLRSFNGNVMLKQSARLVSRTAHGVHVESADGSIRSYDKVVIGAHADQALKLLADPTSMEKSALGAWRYQENHAVLHTDDSILPPKSAAWASWNFARECGADDSKPTSVSYYMNKLQQLKTRHSYIVTLNRQYAVDRDKVIDEVMFTHPVYSFDSMNSQAQLPQLNQSGPIYFCGSYFGYGFHEDAVRSAINVSKVLGVDFDRLSNAANNTE